LQDKKVSVLPTFTMTAKEYHELGHDAAIRQVYDWWDEKGLKNVLAKPVYGQEGKDILWFDKPNKECIGPYFRKNMKKYPGLVVQQMVKNFGNTKDSPELRMYHLGNEYKYSVCALKRGKKIVKVHPKAEGGTLDVSLKKLKDMFCPIVQNLDVNDESVDNFAMLYIEDSFSPRKDETMAQLAERLKYDIKNDKDCSTPLFTPEDISMQRISLDSKRKSWVVIVKLDSKSKTSYIREAASCKSLPYLPTSSITVSVKQRVTKKKCPKNPIRRGFHGCKTYDVYIPMLHHHTKRPIGYEIDMKGTTFDFESTATSNAGIDNDDNDIPTRASTRRRRLLTQRWQGS